MTKIRISRVEFSSKFETVSTRFGFDQEVIDSYEDDLLDLQELWEKQGYIDVFTSATQCSNRWGMIKSSVSDPGASPTYDALYHARVLKSYPDPLIIITFKGEIVPDEEYEQAVILAMIDHDLMFMPYGRKSAHLKKQQRKWVRYSLDAENDKK